MGVLTSDELRMTPSWRLVPRYRVGICWLAAPGSAHFESSTRIRTTPADGPGD